jgi:hypothetical protein
MPKDPWFKFYPADWQNDIKLQSCSLAAQGLLIKLMCFMHQSTRPGYLLINGQKPNKTQTKRITNCHQNEYKTKLKELINAGVLIELDDMIVCPRMVKDQAVRDANREAGKKGGNPTLVNPPLNPTLILRSQKSEVRKRNTNSASVFSLPEWMPEKTWTLFLDHRKLVKAPVSKKAFEDFISKFQKLKDAGWPPGKVVDTMIEKGWRWFKPEWMKDEPNSQPPPPDKIAEERRELEKDLKENPDEWCGKDDVAGITKKLGLKW